MRLLEHKKQVAALVFTLIFSGISHAQTNVKTSKTDGKVTIEQDAQIEKLVSYKTKLNKTDDEKRFRIQIYNGTLEGAQKAKRNFSNEFKAPNYKVRVGKFRTRLEADRYLIQVKNEYPSAFLLQP